MNVCNALSRLISQQDTHRDDDIASDGSDTSPTEMSRGDVGTTLLEVLVVLVILGFVAQVTVPRVYFILANAKGKLAMQQVDALGNALEVYRLDVGELPTSQQGLAALVTRPNETVEWNGPYPKSNLVPKDPWVI